MLFVFFLMIRRPPSSTRTDTLVPDTTLFRSFDQPVADAILQPFHPHADRRLRDAQRLCCAGEAAMIRHHHKGADTIDFKRCHSNHPYPLRSEEHTSELQSLMRNLVCRLLLEKNKHPKKTQKT